jgi:guanylate kinase
MIEELKKMVSNYEVPPQHVEFIANVSPMLIASITAGGKNTVIEKLLKTNKYHFVVSHTTRSPRVNNGELEKSGINYWFVGESKIRQMIEAKMFVEVKIVHQKYIYGTSIDEFQKAVAQSKVPLLEIDVQGVKEFIKIRPKTKAVFLLPPSFSIWQDRLHARGKLSDEELAIRMNTAQTELRTALDSESFIFVVNDDIDQAVTNVESIFIKPDKIISQKNLAAELLLEIEKQARAA